MRWVGKHSTWLVLWVTGIGREWKIGRRPGTGHRKRPEKDSMATQPVYQVETVLRSVPRAQGHLKRGG